MAWPILALGARALGGVAKKLGGKALRWATRGKLLGSGGGREIVRRAGQAAGATIGTAVVARATNTILTRRAQTLGPDMSEYGGDLGPLNPNYQRKYRRMNPANGRALRRAMRRLGAAEKVFKTVFRFNHGKAPSNVRLKGGR